MNQLHAWSRQIRKIVNAFGIASAHQNHEGSFVDDALLRQQVPVGSYKSALLQTIGVALDRKDRDLRFYSANPQNML